MSKPPKPTNFEYLGPDAPRTKRIIDAATACSLAAITTNEIFE